MWSPGYKIRRSTNMLSFIVLQNQSALELLGEQCFLLKRFTRADAPFQVDERRVSTITKTASTFDIDPDTGYLRYKLWGRYTDSTAEYPDIGIFTATVQSSGVTSVWEKAVDKYTFIAGRAEYTFDINQDCYDVNMTPIEDAVYIVFNTPPFNYGDYAVFTFGTINPLVNFNSLQPVRDTEGNFYLSSFGFSQYLKPDARIRTKIRPNRFLVAFPDKITDFKLTEAGLMRDAVNSYWTTPPPYAPEIIEYDIIVRESTGQRFQVTSMTKIYVEDVFCGQNFTLAEIDPRSSLYSIILETV